MQTLPDLLFPRPRLVFIGTAAGRVSAARGAYYANPSNKFWRTLHEIALTPRLYAPHEFAALKTHGIALTDLNKTESGMDHQIGAFDVAGLKAKLARHAPHAIAFTSKKGASIYFNCATRALGYGRQPGDAAPAVFVLTSPSGAAGRHWSIDPWRALAAWFNAPHSN